MKTIAVIPARAGSQRCLNKSKADLGGKPLIAWTIDAAFKSGIFDYVMVTSDDQDILEIADKRGCYLVRRPPELAMAETEMLPVLKHALSFIGSDYDVAVLLQPTSPFRTVEDILAAHEQLTKHKADAVISVTEAANDLAFKWRHAKRLEACRDIVVCNGALYLITREHLELHGDWYNGITDGYKMPKERSLDIDTELDLAFARVIVSKQRLAPAESLLEKAGL